MQVTRVANLTGGEEAHIEAIVKAQAEIYFGNVIGKFQRDLDAHKKEMDAALTKVLKVAELGHDVRLELARLIETYDALLPRLEDVEHEVGL